MRCLLHNKQGNITSLVGAAVAVFILVIIALTAFFNIAADLNPRSLDSNLESDGATEGGTVQNATNMSITMFSTFATIAPVLGIVIIAVAIIAAIKVLG